MNAPGDLASERRIVFVLAAVQFVNILDFMIVMPLGPDFARALAVPVANLGYVGGAYTLAAAVSGIMGSFFLDRFDRRVAMTVSMLGLGAGTALGGIAWDFESLLYARIIAGAFGGPATSVAFAIIADRIPLERRGRATGAVMGAFAAASVLGVPTGLELARIGGWKLPFFAIAGLCFAITAGAAWVLEPMRAHVATARTPTWQSLGALLRPRILRSYLMTALAMGSGFILIPNISAYVQGNLRYPRERLGMLYLCGGVISFVTTRYAGRLVDRYGSTLVTNVGIALLSLTIYAGFVAVPPQIPAPLMFMAFMLAMGLRNVAYNTLTSKVPAPNERAQFMSLQSAVQHLASASGALMSSRMLSEGPNQVLIGMDHVAWASIVLGCALPFVVWRVEAEVRQRVSEVKT